MKKYESWIKDQGNRFPNTAQKLVGALVAMALFGSGVGVSEILSHDNTKRVAQQEADIPSITAQAMLDQLREGLDVLVSNQPNSLHNKIGALTAQPLVFETNSGNTMQTYYAYFNSLPPNLNDISDSDALKFMTIEPVSNNASSLLNTEEAHLNKDGRIVDANGQMVAFAEYLTDQIL